MKYTYDTMIEKINRLETPKEAYDIVIGMVDRTISIDTLPDFYNNIRSIAVGAFQGCKNLALTSLPEGVTKINHYAFANCTNLALASLPEGLMSIGDGAFSDCTSLTFLVFKGTPTSIDSNAFKDCTNLTNIYVPWSEGEVANAPWGATNATIHYNSPIIVYENNGWYYYENGEQVTTKGLIRCNDDYVVYVTDDGSLATGEYSVPPILTVKGYNWGTDGMYAPPMDSPLQKTKAEDVYEDVVREKDGVLYYYKNGICIKNAGVIPVFTNSTKSRIAFIYVRENGRLVTGVLWTDDTTRTYDFGTDARLPVYDITFNFTNVGANFTQSWIATAKNENGEIQSQVITLSAADNCEISSVIVTMGGEDITSTAYANGVVTIAEVTGDVVITASAV